MFLDMDYYYCLNSPKITVGERELSCIFNPTENGYLSPSSITIAIKISMRQCLDRRSPLPGLYTLLPSKQRGKRPVITGRSFCLQLRNIIPRHEHHEKDEEKKSNRIKYSNVRCFYRTSLHRLYRDKQQSPSIECRKWQNVDDRKVE